MSKKYQVTAVDLAIDPALNLRYSGIKLVAGRVEKLSFRNEEFDTVVCAHTLVSCP